MKMNLKCLAVLASCALAHGVIVADDKDGGAADVNVRVSGKMITIGPNGKVHVQNLGDAGADDEAELPKEVQEFLKPRRKPKGENVAPAADGGPTLWLGKVMKIGPDGTCEAADSLPEEIRKLLMDGLAGEVVGGSIRVIGPDGKVHTSSLDEEMLDEGTLSEFVEAAVKDVVGDDLPEELRNELKKAMKSGRSEVTTEVDDMAPSEAASISEKLDTILSRLDKLEQDVQKLQKSKE